MYAADSARLLCLQDAQAMFDSSMSAAAIAQRVQELQAAAGIKAQLVGASLISHIFTFCLSFGLVFCQIHSASCLVMQ